MNHPDAGAPETAMSDSDSISDKGASETGLLFDLAPVFAGTSAIVRDALLRDLKGCLLSREEVAVRLSKQVGRPITTAQIDAFVAESKPHRFPAELVPAWIAITGSRRLLDALARQIGLSVATQEDRDFADLGRAAVQRKKLERKLWERI
jgi:hypothetical protein